MTEVKSYSKIPVTIQALQYTGPEDTENTAKMVEFTDHQFEVRAPDERESSIITAEVYDFLHETWVGVKNGDYIIKGLEGEFYPHDQALFPRSYVEIWA